MILTLLVAAACLAGCSDDKQPLEPVVPEVTVTGSYELYPGLSIGTLVPAGTAVFNGETVEGTLAWKDPSAIYAQVGEHPAAWVFIPDDPKRYLPAEGTVPVHVAVSAIEWELVAEKIYPPLANIGKRPVSTALLSPDGSEYQIFCLMRPETGSYGWQTASVEDVTSWQQQTDGIMFLHALPGTLPAIVQLDQMVRFNDMLLVPEYWGQNRLFLSANGGIDWSQVEINGEKAVRSILGEVGRTGYLTVMTGRTDRYFYRTTDLVTWERSENPVPDDFPEEKFARFTSPDNLTLVGGSKTVNLSETLYNTTWSTEDGLNWTRHDAAPFDEAREGATGAVCNGIFFLIGGTDATGRSTEDIRYSTDRGETWHKVSLPGTSEEGGYSARSYTSVLVDEQKRMLVFNGRKTSTSPWLDEIWRGTPK